MGILNVTPDSFADGGVNFDRDSAVAHGAQMVRDGAEIIDVGGESTRPGADRVSEEEEESRVIPAIKALAEDGIVMSIDTMRASTARKAIEAGASIINDVSGGAADPSMFSTVAELQCMYILMHWRGHSKDMNSKAVYRDVISEVANELSLQLQKALAAGIAKEKIILDPGIGFAKNPEHNWEILDRIDELKALGYPLLIGHSRKRFLGGDRPEDREEATVELSRTLAATGIWGIRVHGVKRNVEAIRA